jgi:hypothetical protein
VKSNEDKPIQSKDNSLSSLLEGALGNILKANRGSSDDDDDDDDDDSQASADSWGED